MREIKFRAYFEHSGLMESFGFDSVYEEGWRDGEYNNDDGTVYLKPDVKVMQYTGLKDKNGVEIYEGDIVRAERNFKIMDDEVVEPKIFEVIYQFASFSLAANGIVEEFGYVYMSEYPPEKMEVIGNIYENPELLNGNKE